MSNQTNEALFELLLKYRRDDLLKPIINRVFKLDDVEHIEDPKLVANPHEKKKIPLADITQAWHELINSTIPAKELANKYGFSDLTHLRKRWEKVGIFDPVVYYNRQKKAGLTGYPLLKLREKIERAGRLHEIEPVSIPEGDLRPVDMTVSELFRGVDV